jgi:hypothetical protein
MGFEVDRRKRKEEEELWQYHDDDDFAKPVKDTGIRPLKDGLRGSYSPIRKAAAGTGSSGSVPGTAAGNSSSGKSYGKKSSPKRVLLILLLSAAAILLSAAITAFTEYRSRRQEQSSESDYFARQTTVSLISQSLPYPEGYTCREVSGQLLIEPYSLIFYLTGSEEAGRSDFATAALFALRAVEGTDSVTFVLEDTGEEYVFKQSVTVHGRPE